MEKQPPFVESELPLLMYGKGFPFGVSSLTTSCFDLIRNLCTEGFFSPRKYQKYESLPET
jgi:hypothetical protein